MSKWTVERLQAVAAGYADMTTFRREQQSAYVTASRLGVLDIVCGHLPRRHRTLTREGIREIAAKYETLAAFRVGDSSAYTTAHKRGWLGDLSFLKRHERTKKPPRVRKKINPMGYWTKDRCAAAAARYETRVAFQRDDNTAYVIAWRRGWLDDICQHMKSAGSRARRFVYRIVSDDRREVYIGITARPGRRYSMHRARPRAEMKTLIDGPHRFEVLTAAPIEFEAAAAMERNLIRKHKADGWQVLNVLPGGEAGGRSDAKWTEEALVALAASCRTRGEMRAKSNAAYVAASRRRLLDEIFANHEGKGLSSKRRPHGHWTLETLTAEALKHPTRRAMSKLSAGAFLAAHRMGLLDTIFAAHPKQGRMATARGPRRRLDEGARRSVSPSGE